MRSCDAWLERMLIVGVLAAAGCGEPVAMGEVSGTGGSTSGTSGTTATAATTGPVEEQPTGTSGAVEPEGARCDEDGCKIDVLLVIDNTFTMGAEQVRLATSLPKLVELLRTVKDGTGEPLATSVNIMVTTTDMGHPLCTYQPNDYTPALGSPIVTPCTEHLTHFDAQELMPELCTDFCPEGPAALAMDPFVHFAGDEHNVIDPDGMGDAVVDALGCIVPQGFPGCNMEAPLEAMLQALGPKKPWNQGERPFLRDDAALLVILLSDETDCSVAPGGFKYFDPEHVDDPALNLYWEDAVGMPGVKDVPSSAICWHSGMTCAAGNEPGVYASCAPEDRGVLHPVSRYSEFLLGLVARGKPVQMLAFTGVPTVSEYNQEQPFEPTKGGVKQLVFHDWGEDDLLASDVNTPAELQHGYGIGPGCVSEPASQGMPPGRIQSVCEALDVADDPATKFDESAVNCRLESICDDSYDRALGALIGGLGPRGWQGPAPG